MKNIIKIALFTFLLIGIFTSCNKEKKELFKEEVKITEKVEIINISEDFYNPNVSLKDFQEKYPWFQGGISDDELVQRRKDTVEVKVYQEAKKNINEAKLKSELEEMFSRVKYYFPKFKTPKIYLYSSYLHLESLMEPVFFRVQDGMIFVDISAFMGEKSKNYEGLDYYLRKSMNAENLLPKTSEIVAETFVIQRPKENKFIDQIIFNGKIKILQEAFLPNIPDYLKMNYTPEQQSWAVSNEGNVWNYFVENDLIFSDDSKLYERFIAVGPFSKFYTEIDQKSSPRIGIFIGWQIAKAFFSQNPDAKLSDFLVMEATEIFNQSKYKPEN